MGTVNFKCLKIIKLVPGYEIEILLSQVDHAYKYFLYIKNVKRWRKELTKYNYRGAVDEALGDEPLVPLQWTAIGLLVPHN